MPRDSSNASIVCRDDSHAGVPLPFAVLDHIKQCDSMYLATAYMPSEHPEQSGLGMNHRGGRTGFIRVDPETHRSIYLADYSGNRFMQSIGNLLSYPKAGAVLPNWQNGDVLYITGETVVHFGDAARKIMRGVHAITRIDITGYRFVRGGLPLLQKGETIWSLYNPPARPLLSENESGHRESSEKPIQAGIYRCKFLSEEIAVFTFKMDGSAKLDYKPGQHVLLDCAMLLHPSTRQYRHMAMRGEEKTLNE